MLEYDFNQMQRRQSLKIFLMLLSVFFLTFSAFNLNNGIKALYIVEFLIGCVCVVSFIKFDSLKVTKKIKLISLIFAHSVSIYLLLALSLNGVTKTTHLWIITVPILSYTLTGIKQGLILTCTYLLLSGIVLYFTSYDTETFVLEDVVDFFYLLISVWILTHFYEKSNSKAAYKLYSLATKDSLTKLYNRHAFYEIYKSYSDKPVTLILLDIDWFKKVNDSYGHDCGDFVLKELATIIQSELPDNASAFRLGGEEFAVLLPELGCNTSMKVANKLLESIAFHNMEYRGHEFKITVSIGMACSDKLITNDLDNLMRNADKYLYKAKENGRNRAEC